MAGFGCILGIVTAFAWGPALVAFGQTQTERSSPSAAVVTVRPEESDELLANPGIGWETFHTTRDRDKSLPDWIPSTVHYARWGWRALEPQPGKLACAFLDKVLKESRDSDPLGRSGWVMTRTSTRVSQ